MNKIAFLFFNNIDKSETTSTVIGMLSSIPVGIEYKIFVAKDADSSQQEFPFPFEQFKLKHEFQVDLTINEICLWASHVVVVSTIKKDFQSGITTCWKQIKRMLEAFNDDYLPVIGFAPLSNDFSVFEILHYFDGLFIPHLQDLVPYIQQGFPNLKLYIKNAELNQNEFEKLFISILTTTSIEFKDRGHLHHAIQRYCEGYFFPFEDKFITVEREDAEKVANDITYHMSKTSVPDLTFLGLHNLFSKKTQISFYNDDLSIHKKYSFYEGVTNALQTNSI